MKTNLDLIFILFRKMKIIFFLLIVIGLEYLLIDCQPLGKNDKLNLLIEMMNPSFRRHRARIRPFLSQWGSPMISIRGTRDTEKISKLKFNLR